jgi:hypothetical protein
LELEKGKKTDKDKVLDYQDQIAENAIAQALIWLDTFNESYGNAIEQMATGITDALVTAWENGGDAALAFRQTVGDVMKDVLANMWRINVLPALMKPISDKYMQVLGLNPDGTPIGGPDAIPDGVITKAELDEFIKTVQTTMPGIISSFENGVVPMLESVNDYVGAVADSNLTGISKAVGSLSEDTALTLAALANSGLYYTIGTFNILTKWDGMISGSEGIGLIPSLVQSQAESLAMLQAIKADTGRIAIATEQTASDLRSVISPLNVRSGAFGVNMN